MKILLIFLCVLIPSCASTFVSEKATEVYADSLRAKAKSIRSNPEAKPTDKQTADEFDRAADLIEYTGKDALSKQSKITDLTQDSGTLQGIYIVLGIIATGILAYYGIRFLLKTGVV